jgi:phosphatidylserine decarboxylase
MAEVSSCITTVNIWDHVNKGDQIGHFEFGGSSHAIIFEKNAKLVFNNQLYSTTENGIEGVKQNLHSFLAEVVPPK